MGILTLQSLLDVVECWCWIKSHSAFFISFSFLNTSMLTNYFFSLENTKMYISVILVLPHYSYSVAKAKLMDSNLVLCRRKDVDCLEGKQDIEPIGTLLILQFCL